MAMEVVWNTGVASCIQFLSYEGANSGAFLISCGFSLKDSLERSGPVKEAITIPQAVAECMNNREDECAVWMVAEFCKYLPPFYGCRRRRKQAGLEKGCTDGYVSFVCGGCTWERGFGQGAVCCAEPRL